MLAQQGEHKREGVDVAEREIFVSVAMAEYSGQRTDHHRIYILLHCVLEPRRETGRYLQRPTGHYPSEDMDYMFNAQWG